MSPPTLCTHGYLIVLLHHVMSKSAYFTRHSTLSILKSKLPFPFHKYPLCQVYPPLRVFNLPLLYFHFMLGLITKTRFRRQLRAALWTAFIMYSEVNLHYWSLWWSHAREKMLDWWEEGGKHVCREYLGWGIQLFKGNRMLLEVFGQLLEDWFRLLMGGPWAGEEGKMGSSVMLWERHYISSWAIDASKPVWLNGFVTW